MALSLIFNLYFRKNCFKLKGHRMAVKNYLKAFKKIRVVSKMPTGYKTRVKVVLCLASDFFIQYYFNYFLPQFQVLYI